MNHIAAFALLVLSIVPLQVSGQAQATMHPRVVTEKPPVLRKEIRGLAPSPRHVWIEGNWAWKGRWVWVPGRWGLPPRGRTPWVAGHWVAISGGWSWVEGKWGR